jgi:hypothetical protein
MGDDPSARRPQRVWPFLRDHIEVLLRVLIVLKVPADAAEPI